MSRLVAHAVSSGEFDCLVLTGSIVTAACVEALHEYVERFEARRLEQLTATLDRLADAEVPAPWSDILAVARLLARGESAEAAAGPVLEEIRNVRRGAIAVPGFAPDAAEVDWSARQPVGEYRAVDELARLWIATQYLDTYRQLFGKRALNDESAALWDCLAFPLMRDATGAQVLEPLLPDRSFWGQRPAGEAPVSAIAAMLRNVRSSAADDTVRSAALQWLTLMITADNDDGDFGTWSLPAAAWRGMREDIAGYGYTGLREVDLYGIPLMRDDSRYRLQVLVAPMPWTAIESFLDRLDRLRGDVQEAMPALIRARTLLRLTRELHRLQGAPSGGDVRADLESQLLDFLVHGLVTCGMSGETVDGRGVGWRGSIRRAGGRLVEMPVCVEGDTLRGCVVHLGVQQTVDSDWVDLGWLGSLREPAGK